MNAITKKQVVILIILIFAVPVVLKSFKITFSVSQAEGNLVIQFNDGQKRFFQGEIAPSMSVLNALYSSSEGGQYEFRYFIDEIGKVNVVSLDGRANNTIGVWHFFLNSRELDPGDLDKVRINKGDVIEARYE